LYREEKGSNWMDLLAIEIARKINPIQKVKNAARENGFGLEFKPAEREGVEK
jgi:hypothetical protein